MNTSLSTRPLVSKRPLAWVYVVLVVVSIFSLLYGWVPALHSHAYIALFAILLALPIAPHFFTTSQFIFIAIYALVVWVNAAQGDPYTFDKKIMDGLMLGMTASMSYYLMMSDDQKIKKWISVCTVLVLIIQTIPSLIVYITSQDTIRTFMGLIYHGLSDYDWGQLYRMGLLSYDMSHTLPLLVPPLIMWLRTKGVSKWWKTLCVICLICTLILAYIYDITTVQILAFFGLGASLLLSPNQHRANVVTIITVSLLLLPFALSTSLQDSLLGVVENYAEGSLKAKVSDARYGLTHDEMTGDISTRQDFYMLSLKTFLESPLTGKNTEEGIGGHSAIFDRLGAFGLVGFLPFLFVLINTTRFCRRRMSETQGWYYLICVMCFVMILLAKNMCRLEEWLVYLVVAPAMLTMEKDAV